MCHLRELASKRKGGLRWWCSIREDQETEARVCQRVQALHADPGLSTNM